MKTHNLWQSISAGRERANLFNLMGWILVFCFSFYFIYNYALRYFDLSSTVYTTDSTGKISFAPSLIIHIAFGMMALLIGPFQFLLTIRKKYPSIHRTVGRIYFISVLISALAATYLAISRSLIIHGWYVFGTGILGLALAWFITAGLAFWAIKKRNFLQHKEWMIRSYVITSGFIIFRLMYESLLAIENLPFKNQVGGIVAWACWSIPLLITEVILQAKKINSASKKSKVPQVV